MIPFSDVSELFQPNTSTICALNCAVVGFSLSHAGGLVELLNSYSLQEYTVHSHGASVLYCCTLRQRS